MTNMRSWWLHRCWWRNRPKPSPTSQSCHQHILSSTYVTNIDVAEVCNIFITLEMPPTWWFRPTSLSRWQCHPWMVVWPFSEPMCDNQSSSISKVYTFDSCTWVLHLMFQTGRGKSYRIIYLELLMRTTRFSLELLAGDNLTRNRPTYKWHLFCFTVDLYRLYNIVLLAIISHACLCYIWYDPYDMVHIVLYDSYEATYLTSNWVYKIQMFPVGFSPHYHFLSL